MICFLHCLIMPERLTAWEQSAPSSRAWRSPYYLELMRSLRPVVVGPGAALCRPTL
jgi:hypothetical protein